MLRKPSAQAQVIDQGTILINVPAGSAAGGAAFGTMYPLLPHQAIHFFNVSCEAYQEDGAGNLQLTALALAIFPLNPDLTNASLDSIWVKGLNYTTPATLGPYVGAVLAATGDPLLELVSNLLVTGAGSTGTFGGILGGFRVSAQGDFINTDPANAHTAEIDLTSVFSFIRRGQ